MPTNILSGTNILLLEGVVALAYFIRGLSGFGSGIVAIPMLALFLPLQLAVPAVAMLDNVAAARHGVEHRDKIVWRELIPLVPMILLGVFIGIYLLKNIDTGILQKGMGVFLLLYSLYMLSGLLPLRRRTQALALPCGLAGGMISTSLGTGGPFYVIYLHLRNHGKLEFRATVAVIFLLDGVLRLMGYLYSGLFDAVTLLAIISALPVMLISMRIGGLLHNRLNPVTVQRLISLLLVGSGILLLSR